MKYTPFSCLSKVDYPQEFQKVKKVPGKKQYGGPSQMIAGNIGDGISAWAL